MHHIRMEKHHSRICRQLASNTPHQGKGGREMTEGEGGEVGGRLILSHARTLLITSDSFDRSSSPRFFQPLKLCVLRMILSNRLDSLGNLDPRTKTSLTMLDEIDMLESHWITVIKQSERLRGYITGRPLMAVPGSCG